MKIISVNVGLPREVHWKGLTVQTGIFKLPVCGPIPIRELNLDGDRQADLTVHGGPYKAVYAYPSEHYAYWRRELPDVAFGWGEFGENLTTAGLSEDNLHIGDRLRIGSAVLAVSQPRLPCYKLDLKFDRKFHVKDIIKRFLQSNRSGFYFSVVEPGVVESENAEGGPFKPHLGLSGKVEEGGKIEGVPFKPHFGLGGDVSNADRSDTLSAIEIMHRDPLQVTVSDINRLYLGKTDAHPDLLHRALNLTALPQNWEDDLIERAQSR